MKQLLSILVTWPLVLFTLWGTAMAKGEPTKPALPHGIPENYAALIKNGTCPILASPEASPDYDRNAGS